MMDVVFRRIAAVLILPLTLVACDNVVGGGRAEFEVLVVPDGSGSHEVAGSLDVRLRVLLDTPDAFPVEISGGEREVTLDLLQTTPEELGTVSILPGVHQGVTVRFAAVEAEVGNGEVPTPVRVDIGEQESLRKDHAAQILARDGDRVAVIVDLRAGDWLGAAEDGVVPAETFLNAVRIRVEPR